MKNRADKQLPSAGINRARFGYRITDTGLPARKYYNSIYGEDK